MLVFCCKSFPLRAVMNMTLFPGVLNPIKENLGGEYLVRLLKNVTLEPICDNVLVHFNTHRLAKRSMTNQMEK